MAVPEAGRYFVNVWAASGASNYTVASSFGPAAQNSRVAPRQAIVSLKGGKTLQQSSITATTSLAQKFNSQIHVSSRQGDLLVTRSEGALSADSSVLAKRRAIKDPDGVKVDVAMFIDVRAGLPCHGCATKLHLSGTSHD